MNAIVMTKECTFSVRAMQKERSKSPRMALPLYTETFFVPSGRSIVNTLGGVSAKINVGSDELEVLKPLGDVGLLSLLFCIDLNNI